MKYWHFPTVACKIKDPYVLPWKAVNQLFSKIKKASVKQCEIKAVYISPTTPSNQYFLVL